MGWFLEKKTRSRHQRSSHLARRATREIRNRYTLLRGFKFLGWLVIAASLTLGWWWTEQALTRYVGGRHPQHIAPEQVHLKDAPPWMSLLVQRGLGQEISRNLSADPLDQQSLSLAVSALAASPWVDSVQEVRRSHDKVHVRAHYRQPIAAVAARDGFHLVDERGVRLPGLYLPELVPKLGLPSIVGVASAPPRSGECWPGADLEAGLSLIRLIQDQPYLHQIRAFDVSDRDERGRIRLALRTAEGLVRWGLAPGQERAIEPDVQTKKHWLASIYRQRGAIDAGGKIVDVFGPAVFVHQPDY